MRKCEFSVREVGVGGMEVVVPILSRAFGGDVSRRDKVCVFGDGPG